MVRDGEDVPAGDELQVTSRKRLATRTSYKLLATTTGYKLHAAPADGERAPRGRTRTSRTP